MDPPLLDFSDAVGELRQWVGHRVTVTIGHMAQRQSAAALVGVLYGPFEEPEDFEETRQLLGAVVLAI
ncbi:MAG: hypothetical protein QOK34_1611 [Gaiellaceae bacterium]|nr:hypothetical protein [Gaiellaceae bacterium]